MISMNFILFRPHLHRKPRADSSPVFVFGCASDKVVDKTTRRRGGESRSPRGRVGGGDVIGRDREGPQGWPFFGGKRKKNKQTKQTNKPGSFSSSSSTCCLFPVWGCWRFLLAVKEVNRVLLKIEGFFLFFCSLLTFRE